MNAHEWIDRLPLLLDSRQRGRQLLRQFCHYLGDHADPDGTNVFPSVDKVATWLHVTRRTVLGLYRQAEESKLIIIEKRGHKTIKVRLNFDLPFEELDLPARQVAEERRHKISERVRRHRAKMARIGSDQCAPNPVTTEPEAPTVCAPNPVTSWSESAPNPVTTQALPLIDQQEDHPHLLTDAADATTGLDGILEGELVEEPSDLPAVRGDVVPPVANLSASWLLFEEPAKGRKPAADAPRFDAAAWSMPSSSKTPTTWTHELVAYWVERCRERGFEPAKRQCGQAGKEIRALVAAGNNPNHIAAAAMRAADKRGSWIMRAMADVQPGNWSAQRPGRQVVLEDRTIQLPAGATANQARLVSAAALFPGE